MEMTTQCFYKSKRYPYFIVLYVEVLVFTKVYLSFINTSI